MMIRFRGIFKRFYTLCDSAKQLVCNLPQKVADEFLRNFMEVSVMRRRPSD